MSLPAIRFPQEKIDYIEFKGGLDTDTPPLQLPPGFTRDSQNYEIDINGGYVGVTGYERYDGHARPSDASYAILDATITGAWTVGNTLTGVTSGATGVIAAAAADYFVITKITGNFHAVSETLNIGGSPVAVSSGTQVVSGASTAKLHAQYKNAAADIYRSDIAAVPGSETVLGVFLYNDVLYAIRNNAGGTAAVIHKATAGGWSAITLYNEISFTAGGGDIDEGDTLTQGANTATIKRVIITSGTLGGGTAAGRLIVTTPSPGNFGAGAATTTGAGTLTLSGAQTAITILPSGRYEFDIQNFGGQIDQKRVYGCDGINRGFEFDGDVYAPITTGMNPDKPSHVSVHKKHLFFSFKSSAQHSGIKTPFVWTPITGATELAVGDTITGFKRLTGSETGKGALCILTKDSTNILYGSSSSDWDLINYNDEQGGIAFTDQNIEGRTLMLDTRGLVSLATTANYGNFISATLTKRINKWIKQRRALSKSSCVVRDKSQYRLFFSDKYALYVTFGTGKIIGMKPIKLDHSVDCIWSGEKNDGSEEIYFGSSNGMVYQMEKGTSFDGNDITGYLYLTWDSQNSVRQRKRYKRAMLEISGNGYAEFNFRCELGYGSTDIQQPANKLSTVDLTTGTWDSGLDWDSGLVWDGRTLRPDSVSIEGSGENISIIISHSADYFSPMRFSGAMLHYILRRGLR